MKLSKLEYYRNELIRDILSHPLATDYEFLTFTLTDSCNRYFGQVKFTEKNCGNESFGFWEVTIKGEKIIFRVDNNNGHLRFKKDYTFPFNTSHLN